MFLVHHDPEPFQVLLGAEFPGTEWKGGEGVTEAPDRYSPGAVIAASSRDNSYNSFNHVVKLFLILVAQHDPKLGGMNR